jgi:DNA-binding MarR family transcriptional regulator
MTTSQSILRAAQRINSLIAEGARPLGLTPTQIDIMILMSREPNLSGREITERCSIDRSTLAAVMRTLRAKKLVDRKPNKDDERAYHNYLTKTGLAKIEDCVMIVSNIDHMVDDVVERVRGSVSAKMDAIAAFGKDKG